MLRTAPDAAAGPAALPADGWLPVGIPGTAAQALAGAGVVPDAADLDGHDWWFRATPADAPGAGPWRLELDGVATVHEVWLDGVAVHRGDSMFAPAEIGWDRADPPGEVVICCRALSPLLARRRPRPRWRTRLTAQQNLRWYRTSLLGRMPGGVGHLPVVGPYRAVRLVPAAPAVRVRRLEARCVGAGGIVLVELAEPAPGPVTLACGEARLELPAGASGGRLELAAVERWWPHGYGAQPLYPVRTVGADPVELGAVGFRTVAADRADGGFTLYLNGSRVFARGAVYTPADALGGEPDPVALRAELTAVAAAGLVLLRIGGTSLYPTEAFLRICDELGLLVWQDLMLTALDPPQDEEWEAGMVAETREVCRRLVGHPSTAVLCGGAETEQQAAFTGLPPARRMLPFQHETLGDVAAEALPGVPYVANCPTGGSIPVRTGTAVTQYFGVGAYLRPLTDVAVADVRFAGECLAFSIPPEADGGEPEPSGVGHAPVWKTGIPRDPGAGWDFEDVRDHYLETFFGVVARDLRYADPARYLELGRAAVTHAMGSTLAAWRRPGSRCAGAVVLAWRDALPGAGFGLCDHRGRPKAPLLALADLLAPVAVFGTDQGLDGLVVHVVNDGPRKLAGELSVQLFDAAGGLLEQAATSLEVGAHDGRSLDAEAVLGGFRDLTAAYRFGPPSVEAVRLAWSDDAGHASEHVFWPGGPRRDRQASLGLAAVVGPAGDGRVQVEISTRQPAQWVSLDVPGYQPSTGWFHLVPGHPRIVGLTPRQVGAPAPTGDVRAVNAQRPVRLTAG